MDQEKVKKCQKIFQRACKTQKLTEAIIFMENSDRSVSLSLERNKNIDSPMNLASITKLFVTACVMQLVGEKRLSLSDKIGLYLSESVMKGLHVYHGKDYSDELTIRHLLFQTSGLPDYYFCKTKNGESYEQRMLRNEAVTREEYLRDGKAMAPLFAPGKKGRAYYGDMNFDLLGMILENLEGEPLYKIFQKRIFTPLNLTHTYVLSEECMDSPLYYYKGKPLTINRFLCSFPASGGGVTTAREYMIFLKAFFHGELFPKELWSDLKEHNRLQILYGCVRYSGGHMYFHAGYLFYKYHTFRGHCGATGCAAFYCEESDLFCVCDLNYQNAYYPANLLIRLELCLRDGK